MGNVFFTYGVASRAFGFVRRLTTANGIHKKQDHMLAGACACLPVSERAASILPRRFCRSPQRTGGPMTGCGTERYADWFFDLDGTLVDSAPGISRGCSAACCGRKGLPCPNWTRGASGRFWKTSSADLPIWPLRIWSASSASTGRATAPAPLTKARRSLAYRRCSSGCRGGAAGCLWLPTSRRT